MLNVVVIVVVVCSVCVDWPKRHGGSNPSDNDHANDDSHNSGCANPARLLIRTVRLRDTGLQVCTAERGEYAYLPYVQTASVWVAWHPTPPP